LAKQLCLQYYATFGVAKQRRHATESVIDHLLANEPSHWPPLVEALIPPLNITQPALAMPEQYRVTGDAIASYRAYYQSPEKRVLAVWSLPRTTPPWWTVKSLKRPSGGHDLDDQQQQQQQQQQQSPTKKKK
jgi:hypothetical protein